MNMTNAEIRGAADAAYQQAKNSVNSHSALGALSESSGMFEGSMKRAEKLELLRLSLSLHAGRCASDEDIVGTAEKFLDFLNGKFRND